SLLGDGRSAAGGHLEACEKSPTACTASGRPAGIRSVSGTAAGATGDAICGPAEEPQSGEVGASFTDPAGVTISSSSHVANDGTVLGSTAAVGVLGDATPDLSTGTTATCPPASSNASLSSSGTASEAPAQADTASAPSSLPDAAIAAGTAMTTVGVTSPADAAAPADAASARNAAAAAAASQDAAVVASSSAQAAAAAQLTSSSSTDGAASPEPPTGLVSRRSTIIAIDGAPGPGPAGLLTSSGPMPFVPIMRPFRSSLTSSNGRGSSRSDCRSPSGSHNASGSADSTSAGHLDSPQLPRRVASPALKDTASRPGGPRSPVHRVMLQFDGPRASTRAGPTAGNNNNNNNNSGSNINSNNNGGAAADRGGAAATTAAAPAAAAVAATAPAAPAAAAPEEGSYVLLLRGGIPVICGPPPPSQSGHSAGNQASATSPPPASVHTQRLPSPDGPHRPQQQQQQVPIRRQQHEEQAQQQSHGQRQVHQEQQPQQPHQQLHEQQRHPRPDPLCGSKGRVSGGGMQPGARSGGGKVAAAWSLEESRRAPLQGAAAACEHPRTEGRDPEPGRGGKLQPLSSIRAAAAQLSARLEQLLKPVGRPRSSQHPLDRSSLSSPPCMQHNPTSVTAPGGIVGCGSSAWANDWRLRRRAQSLPQIGLEAIGRGQQLRLPALPSAKSVAKAAAAAAAAAAAGHAATTGAAVQPPVAADGCKDAVISAVAVVTVPSARAAGRAGGEHSGGGMAHACSGGGAGDGNSSGGSRASVPAVVAVPPRLLELPVRRRPPPLSPHGGLPRRGSPFGGGAGGGALLGGHPSFLSRADRQQQNTRFEGHSLSLAGTGTGDGSSGGSGGDQRPRQCGSRGSGPPLAVEDSCKSVGSSTGCSDSGLPRNLSQRSGPQTGPAAFPAGRPKERLPPRQAASRVRPQPLRLFSSTDGGDSPQAEERTQPAGPSCGLSAGGTAYGGGKPAAVTGAAAAGAGAGAVTDMPEESSSRDNQRIAGVADGAGSSVLPSLHGNSPHADGHNKINKGAVQPRARFAVQQRGQQGDRGHHQGADGPARGPLQARSMDAISGSGEGSTGGASTGADAGSSPVVAASGLSISKSVPDLRPYVRRKAGAALASAASPVTTSGRSSSSSNGNNNTSNSAKPSGLLLPSLVNQNATRPASRSGSTVSAPLPVVAAAAAVSPRAQ
ncbi:hypothetical protein Agub_g8081, partial [Astrephomene gubernaculifera]